MYKRQPFGDGFGGIACSIQFVGYLKDIVAQIAHFSKAAGIVNDGAVSIIGNNHAYNGKHADGSYRNTEHGISDAKRFNKLICTQCSNADSDYGRHNADQAIGDTGKMCIRDRTRYKRAY